MADSGNRDNVPIYRQENPADNVPNDQQEHPADNVLNDQQENPADNVQNDQQNPKWLEGLLTPTAKSKYISGNSYGSPLSSDSEDLYEKYRVDNVPEDFKWFGEDSGGSEAGPSRPPDEITTASNPSEPNENPPSSAVNNPEITVREEHATGSEKASGPESSSNQKKGSRFKKSWFKKAWFKKAWFKKPSWFKK